jgi:tetratricopeptide (TPR) repeat protein
MSGDSTGQRRRGIQASRLKLMQAKSAAGFKTQAAIAERIADDENLDSPPKDAVNRAFRELSVEHETLERIARALGVASQTLLPEPQEASTGTDSEPGSNEAGPSPSSARWLWIVAVVVVAAVAGYLTRGPSISDQVSRSFVVDQFRSLNGGAASLLIVPIEGLDGGEFEQALREQLAPRFKLASETATALSLTGQQALDTDARLEIVADSVGRWLGLSVFLQANGLRHQVYAISLPSARFASERLTIARQINDAVLAAIGVPDLTPVPFPLRSAQSDFLHGQDFLDEPASEINIRRAQSRFQAALRADSSYARAQAGLCRALLEEFWMDDEQRALRDAALPCAQAQQLAPEDSAVLLAQARFLQVTGRNDEAIVKYREILASHGDLADALTGLAVSLLHAFQSNGDREQLDAAATAARRAAAVDPAVWKPLYYLGNIEVMANRIDAALAAVRSGLQRDENEYLLVNLGSYLTCSGDFAEAKQAYERAQELSPGAYVGDEFMGQLHYFMGDFDEALRLRQRALDSFPGGQPKVHEMWGNLADSLRQVGRKDAAIEAYREAATVAERDIMSGNGRASDRAARAYYYTVLSDLADSLIPSAVLDRLYAELDDIAAEQVDPVGFRLMAMTYARRGELDKARAVLTKATARCTGYSRHPDLRQLSTG